MHDRGPELGLQRVLRIVGMTIAGVIGAAVFALAFGWFVQLLWNWLMPGIFGLATIGYWQAFGLVILGKLIFGGVGAGHGGRPRHDPGRWEKHGHFDRYVQRRSAAGTGTESGSGDSPGP
ncbi:MAG: hypothetical protein NTU62_10420 [Spirochaetes bacterium]|nr:hypothetical protein [Spirochaetota bacterium]